MLESVWAQLITQGNKAVSVERWKVPLWPPAAQGSRGPSWAGSAVGSDLEGRQEAVVQVAVGLLTPLLF